MPHRIAARSRAPAQQNDQNQAGPEAAPTQARDAFVGYLQGMGGGGDPDEAGAPEGEAGEAGEAPPAPTLQSARFAAVSDFQDVLAGERFLKWGNCQGAPTFAVQGALSALEHDPGPVDGLWGPRTNAALMGFQGDNGLGADGVVGPLTLGKLDALDPGGLGPKKGGSGSGVSGGGTIDPRLEHQVSKKNGQFVDPEAVGPTVRLPFEQVDPGSDWDGARIIKKWTQIDLDPLTATDAHRCAANAAVAPRILAGANATLAFDAELIKRAQQQLASPHLDAARKVLVGAKLAALGLADAEIRFSTATYHSLDAIADATKTIMTRDPTGASSGAEGANIHEMATDTAHAEFRIPGSIGDVHTFCDLLAPGEAWMVQVDTDVLPGGDAPDVQQVDHFVTVGCVPSKPPDQGGVYLYDPWPRKGDQTLFRDKSRVDFMEYFTDGRGGMKYSEWLTRTTPAAS